MTDKKWNEARKRDAEKIKNFFLAAAPEIQLALARDLALYWEEYGSHGEDEESVRTLRNSLEI